MKVGDVVTAAELISETNFMGSAYHVHAREGDLGRVRQVDGAEWLTVTWDRSGTTTDCHVTEVVRVAKSQNASAARLCS